MTIITKVFFLTTMLFASNFAKAQNMDNEKMEVKKVIKTYLTVTDLKDSTAILKAFHPDAKLMSVNSKGELKQMSQIEWWQRITKIVNSVVRKSKITVLDISGISAVVKVEFEKSNDLITLLKFNNEWKIVNKTLSIVL
jgi:hypothetical protein